MNLNTDASCLDRSITLKSVKERSKLSVISTINLAKERIGVRQALEELAATAFTFTNQRQHLDLKSIVVPMTITAEKFISEAIDKKWQLTKTFKCYLKYLGQSCDELYTHYYYEAIFSQPTAAHPIPQATASVFFRVENERVNEIKAPAMWFRLEGGRTDHNVLNVAPTVDWILALIQIKLKLFQRIEAFKSF